MICKGRESFGFEVTTYNWWQKHLVPHMRWILFAYINLNNCVCRNTVAYSDEIHVCSIYLCNFFITLQALEKKKPIDIEELSLYPTSLLTLQWQYGSQTLIMQEATPKMIDLYCKQQEHLTKEGADATHRYIGDIAATASRCSNGPPCSCQL